MTKYNRCDTLHFGAVFGKTSVFLIQNMCPATINYLEPYIDKLGVPVTIGVILTNEVTQKAKLILELGKLGKKVLFTNAFDIYNKLVKNLTH